MSQNTSQEGITEETLTTPMETPLQEFWRVFKRDRLAMAGFGVLMLLLVAAIAGKALTEWTVVFDPANCFNTTTFTGSKTTGKSRSEPSRPSLR